MGKKGLRKKKGEMTFQAKAFQKKRLNRLKREEKGKE